MRSKRYEADVLAAGGRRRERPDYPRVPAEFGMVVEDAAGEFCGAVVGWEKDAVTLEDRYGRRRAFPFGAGSFLLEGQPVTLVRPPPGAGAPGRAAPGAAASSVRTTASGSVAAPQSRAKVARASRIYVEGRHDAELVERIWGDDLRDVGVVVEYLGGIDDLPAIVAGFGPQPGRRLGVLVDHLVDGSKESKIAAKVTSPHVLVVGHPFIDVWAAVKPAVLGFARWPDVPRGIPWKEGVLRAIGWPERHGRGMAADPALGDQLRRSGAGLPRPGRGADRLRHRARRPVAAAGSRTRASGDGARWPMMGV